MDINAGSELKPLQLQVVQLQPVPGFTIVSSTLPPAANPAAGPQLDASPQLYLNPPATVLLKPSVNLQVKQMDINLSLDVNLMKSNPLSSNISLNLSLNQVLVAKVIDTQILQNTITLSIADKTVVMQPQTPVTLQSGQSLQLQVSKLLPSPEFKVISSGSNPTAGQSDAAADSPQILKLLNQPLNLASVGLGNNRSPANIVLNQLVPGQQLQGRLLSIAGGKLSLEVYASAPASTTPPTGGAAGNAGEPAKPTVSAGKQPVPTSSLAAPDVKTAQPAKQIITLNAKQLLLLDPENPSGALSKAATAALSQLPPGSRLILQVLKPGAAPVFSLSLPEKTTVLTEQSINQLLKQLLPTQASPTVLLNQLQQNLARPENFGSVAETLKQLAQQILAAIPPQAQLSQPAQLKQSLAQSGLFLEAKLAEMLSSQNGAPLQEDMKVKLVKFVALLKLEIAAQTQPGADKQSAEILKDLLQKANSSLAKLTLDQFSSLPKDESPKQTWTLELPFFFQQLAHSVQIEIEQDKAGAKPDQHRQPEKNWAVSISLSPPDLGTIYCRITCYDGAVNTRFWSDAPTTVASITEHLDYLKSQFEQKGLKTGFMDAQQGKPATTHVVKQALASLLNEKV
jgi:hypothetical protein